MSMKKIALLFAAAFACMGAGAAVDVYFLRHGETTWNREGKLQGSVSHTDLTADGVRMAEETAKGLAAAGLTFGRIYTSPYRRAAHTAEIIAGKGGPAPVPDGRLREMCFGVYEGAKYVKGKYPDDNLRMLFEDPERYEPRGKGAETFAEVGARLRSFLENEIRPLDGKVDRVLCVAHSLVLKALVRELAGEGAPAQAKKAIQSNCCVHHVRYEGGKFALKETGRIFYSPEKFKAKRNIGSSKASVYDPKANYPKADPARIDAIAAHLPERPGTPAPRPSNRAAWARLSGLPEAQRLVETAGKIRRQPIPELPDELYCEFSQNGNRSHYEKPYFRMGSNFNLFMLAEALEWKGRFIPHIKSYLEAILGQKSWTVPAHDGALSCFKGRKPLVKLFSTQRAWLVAYAIDWYGDKLPPELVARAKSECRRRILDPYLKACRDLPQIKETGSTWFFGLANWSPVCHAGCVGTALAILDDRRERAECIEAAERAMPYYISGFKDDGYCSEGMGYWDYGFGHYVGLVSMAIQATGGFSDLGSSAPKVARVAAYAFGFQLERGLSPHFADGGGAPDSSVMEMAHRFWPQSVPDSYAAFSPLLGTTSNYGRYPACCTVAIQEFGPKGRSPKGGMGERLPPSTVFPVSQVYLFRSGKDDGSIAIGAKGGNNGEFHNHNDIGSYAISLRGSIVAGDVGGEPYTRRTFSAQRYVSDVLNSFGHPVPRVGGELQGTGDNFAAKVLKVSSSADREEVSLDIGGAYACKSLKRLVRTFIYDRAGGTVTVRDEVEFSQPSAFDVPVTTFAQAKRTAGGWSLSLGNARLDVSVTVKGGEWEWEDREIDNSKPKKPRRLAVTFTKPVTSAMVEFCFKEGNVK